ncbi:hypothetical protein NSQ93_22190 [Bacillus sp. FSL W8-0445]|uniref:hypothetical protein n=1 Tax=Bacillota TaxID=1239 RepID=UPI000779B115|nr:MULTISPECIES: hypothetical protein [Bacillota]KYC77098.1 hypothetical protein B4092_4835 [Bacillus licheniformis]MDE1407076.1 hypothetical protein [Bacillus licheniformis]NFT30642.1 hypothetical protein [Clostridium sporogenes]OJT57387.1 hypothetical protein BFP47_11820 [Bacillus licheniformis]OJT69971.1 hypothetical protein BFP46_05070 [Bacillus licheniformis]
MDGTFLGKIVQAEFGTVKERDFLLGLQLSFKFNRGDHVSDGGYHIVNVSENCFWESEIQKYEMYERVLKDLKKVLDDAKVNYVSELIGKPIEIEIEGDRFKSFRILTEVL